MQKRRKIKFKNKRWWKASNKQCVSGAAILTQIMNSKRLWMRTQGLHKFKLDKIPAQRTGSEYKAPPLTKKKLLAVGIFW